ncbi:MAG: GldG family protein [Opitutae bacterium]|nr:GldG family protein [Opitutae bacterium]
MSFFESFRATRWLRTLNLVLQAILFTTFCGGLNYLALHYPSRFDLTSSRRYSLSPETLSYLRNLQRPVQIVVTVTEEQDTQVFADIRSLLKEYANAAAANEAGGRLAIEYLDIYQNRRKAEQYGIEQSNPLILFLSGDQRRVVTAGDLYRVVGSEKKDFRGEQAFTAAILDVSSPERKKIYFLTGHGEYRIDKVDPRNGLSALADELRLRNFAVDTLDVSFRRKVPEDAALVIVTAPQSVEPFVQEQLRQYLSNRAGRVILMLAPGLPHGLDDLLYDWGVMVDDDVIYDTSPEDVTEEGDLKIRCFAENHPIVQSLVDRQIALRVGPSRSVRPEPGRAQGSGLTLTTLAATSATAWGERSYRLRQTPVYNEGVDIKGIAQMEPKNRLGLAVASERVQARGNLPFSVRGGRLVVFGTADLVTNNRLQGAQGNYNLFFNAINWTVDRDTQLNLPPRPIEKFQLALSQQELLRLRYCLLLLVPGIAALLGIMVYWTRRS